MEIKYLLKKEILNYQALGINPANNNPAKDEKELKTVYEIVKEYKTDLKGKIDLKEQRKLEKGEKDTDIPKEKIKEIVKMKLYKL